MKAKVIVSDCVVAMQKCPDNSVEAVVTDPPYFWEFAGSEWDRLYPDKGKWRGKSHEPTIETLDDTPQHRAGTKQPAYLKRCLVCGGGSSGAYNRCQCEVPDFRNPPSTAQGMQDWHFQWATEAFRILKPGGYLVSMGGPRTNHRMVCAIEDAGFEVRDSIGVGVRAWVNGSGFPKSLNLSKALDRAAKAERAVVGHRTDGRYASGFSEAAKRAQGGVAHEYSAGWVGDPTEITEPATDLAKQWDGWGTSLKPSWECICVARKPLIGTLVENIVKFQTGAINVDGCRVAYEEGGDLASNPSLRTSIAGGNGGHIFPTETDRRFVIPNKQGRWPSNVVLDKESATLLDEIVGSVGNNWKKNCGEGYADEEHQYAGGSFGGGAYKGATTYVDSRGPSRYFFVAKDEPVLPIQDEATLPFLYAPKASRRERNAGLDSLEGSKLRLRSDLSDEQREFVMAELLSLGVSP